MPMVRAGGGADKIRLNLYGYAFGHADAYGNDSGGNVRGNGTYTLSGNYIDRIRGVSGSMTVAYTTPQGQSTTRTLSAGQTILVGNANNVTFSWNNTTTYRGWDGNSSEGSVAASIAVDVYF